MKTRRERLVDVFESILGKSTVLIDATDLESDLGADSLDLCEIAMGVEDEFLVDAPDDVLQSWKTFGSILQWVEANAPSDEVVARALAKKQ